MIVDASAIVAIVLGEPDAPVFARLIAAAPVIRISAATFVEVGVVVDAGGNPVLSGALDALLDSSRAIIEPLTESQARIAREAYRRFGKASGHPARLNLGDCFAYALARELAEPLLFKGDDFALTDIELVVEPTKSKRMSEIVAAYGAPAT